MYERFEVNTFLLLLTESSVKAHKMTSFRNETKKIKTHARHNEPYRFNWMRSDFLLREYESCYSVAPVIYVLIFTSEISVLHETTTYSVLME